MDTHAFISIYLKFPHTYCQSSLERCIEFLSMTNHHILPLQTQEDRSVRRLHYLPNCRSDNTNTRICFCLKVTEHGRRKLCGFLFASFINQFIYISINVSELPCHQVAAKESINATEIFSPGTMMKFRTLGTKKSWKYSTRSKDLALIHWIPSSLPCSAQFQCPFQELLLCVRFCSRHTGRYRGKKSGGQAMAQYKRQ